MKGQKHNDRHLCQSRSDTRPRNLICNKFQDAAAVAGLKHIQFESEDSQQTIINVQLWLTCNSICRPG